MKWKHYLQIYFLLPSLLSGANLAFRTFLLVFPHKTNSYSFARCLAVPGFHKNMRDFLPRTVSKQPNVSATRNLNLLKIME